jgi:hypothetical protein
MERARTAFPATQRRNCRLRMPVFAIQSLETRRLHEETIFINKNATFVLQQCSDFVKTSFLSQIASIFFNHTHVGRAYCTRRQECLRHFALRVKPNIYPPN